MLITDAIRADETTVLLAQPQVSSGYIGRAWNWVKSNSSTIVKGALATAGAVGMAAAGFFAVKEFIQAPASSHLYEYGIATGIATPLILQGVLPETVATKTADIFSRWSFEFLYGALLAYSQALCPRQECRLWDPNNPPLLAQQLATCTFASVASAIVLLSFRTFTQSHDATYTLPREGTREVPLALFLEAGVHNNLRIAIEQAPKIVLGLTALILNQTNVIQAKECLYLSYYLFGHTGGVISSKGYLWLKNKLIGQITNDKVRKVIEKIGVMAELAALGALVSWQADASYLLSGAVAGAAKITILDKFQNLSHNDEDIRPITFKRADNIAKGIFLAVNLAWYIALMTDPAADVPEIVAMSSLLAACAVSYPLTRYLAGAFHPEEQGPETGQEGKRLLNSLRFYFVNYQEALLLPYMFLRDADEVGVVGSHARYPNALMPVVGLTSLGLAIGNNRALQGLRSRRSPSAVSDLAFITACYILTKQWLNT